MYTVVKIVLQNQRHFDFEENVKHIQLYMPKNKKLVPRSASERLQTVNETKMRCIDHGLTGDVATTILFRMLDNYHRDGTIYINKELNLNLRHQTPRKYVVNLYNDRSRKDTVIIKALADNEIDAAMDAQSRILAERNARHDPAHTDDRSESDDSEAPDLIDT